MTTLARAGSALRLAGRGFVEVRQSVVAEKCLRFHGGLRSKTTPEFRVDLCLHGDRGIDSKDDADKRGVSDPGSRTVFATPRKRGVAHAPAPSPTPGGHGPAGGGERRRERRECAGVTHCRPGRLPNRGMAARPTPKRGSPLFAVAVARGNNALWTLFPPSFPLPACRSPANQAWDSSNADTSDGR